MTRTMAVGLLIALLGLLYGLMYAGWSRRARRHQPGLPAPLLEPDAASPSSEAGSEPEMTDCMRPVGGVYVSTTTSESRHDRVVAGGLGTRARAVMHVDRWGVRWEREGAGEVRVDAAQLLAVSLERGMAGKFVGQPRLVVVSWRGSDGASYATGFLPRFRRDIVTLVAAVDRLRTVSTPSDGAP